MSAWPCTGDACVAPTKDLRHNRNVCLTLYGRRMRRPYNKLDLATVRLGGCM